MGEEEALVSRLSDRFLACSDQAMVSPPRSPRSKTKRRKKRAAPVEVDTFC